MGLHWIQGRANHHPQTRYANSIHSQLRVGRSNLNSHLFAIGRSSTQGCICNCPNESVEHVLLDCFIYQEERQAMFDYIKNTRNILCGKLETYNRKSLVSVLLFGEYPHDYDRYPYMYIQQVALQSSPIFPGEDQASTIQVCAPTYLNVYQFI